MLQRYVFRPYPATSHRLGFFPAGAEGLRGIFTKKRLRGRGGDGQLPEWPDMDVRSLVVAVRRVVFSVVMRNEKGRK